MIILPALKLLYTLYSILCTLDSPTAKLPIGAPPVLRITITQSLGADSTNQSPLIAVGHDASPHFPLRLQHPRIITSNTMDVDRHTTSL